MPLKKVVIKINSDGTIEIPCKDKDIAVVLVYPDNSEVEVFEGEKKVLHNLPPPTNKRIDP